MPMINRKIFTCNIKEINVKEGNFYLYGKEIGRVELIGVVIEEGKKYIRILDFYTETILYKSVTTVIHSHRCLFKCKLFMKGGKICLLCLEATRVDLYEEIFFIVEANKLNEKEKITWGEKKQEINFK